MKPAMPRKPLTLVLFLALCAMVGLSQAFGAASPWAPQEPETPPSQEEKAKEDKSEDQNGEKDEKEKKDKEKSFDDAVADMERIEGLFNLYRNQDENKALIEIAPDQFDKDYLYSAKTEQATGERGLYGTIMREQYVFQWRRFGKRVQLVQKNVRFRADPGSPAAKAVEHSFSDSVMASAKVLSQPHPERESVLIDLNELLLSRDLHGMGQGLKARYNTGYKLNKDDSGFVFLKSFPKNSEIGASMNFQASEVKRSSVTLPDPRSLSLRFRYSLVELPENDYMPRISDDRVGYFVDMHMDYTDDQPETPYVRYIARWNLKKKDPQAEVSEPVEPIVYWLENSIPHKYRDAMRDGILLWNDAFERAGFRNAVVVKQQPDDADWDPADIRYNTIRWMIGYDASFAIGPSHSNPYTGQLIDADIGISEGILRLGARRRYELYVHPVQAMQRLKQESLQLDGFSAPGDGRHLCDYGQGLAEKVSMAYDVLSSRPSWDAGQEEEFVRQYTMELLAHEVGHTLGLRHNFRASIIHGLDQLSDTETTRQTGLAASVMDYNPPVIALPGEEQGDYFPTVVGSYDHWAIEYGYKPIPGADSPEDELDELNQIASRGGDPLLPYATDEDAGLSPKALDPRNTRYDFAADPMEWFSHEYKIVRELWTNMESRLLREGDSYHVLRRAFGGSFTPYFRGAHVAMKYIGGIYHNRDHFGDPQGRLPYVPVPAAEQRRAMRFLQEEIWPAQTFLPAHNLLRKLQFQRHRDFEGSAFRADRLDYPLHDAVLGIQGEILSDLYDPLKLSRILDLQLMIPEGEERFTLVDLFQGIQQGIWTELESSENIHSFRRNLQREHLRYLTQMVLQPDEDLPGDAIALARANLVQLQGAINRALSRSVDAMTRAHLQESLDRIGKTLDAGIEQRLFASEGSD